MFDGGESHRVTDFDGDPDSDDAVDERFPLVLSVSE